MRKIAAAALVALLASPAVAGDIVGREEAKGCTERLQLDEDYLLDTQQKHDTGAGYNAGSEVTLCGLCLRGLRISAGSSFRGVDIDLFLRHVKGKVTFSGNLLPVVSRLREWCRRHAESEEGGRPQ